MRIEVSLSMPVESDRYPDPLTLATRTSRICEWFRRVEIEPSQIDWSVSGGGDRVTVFGTVEV